MLEPTEVQHCLFGWVGDSLGQFCYEITLEKKNYVTLTPFLHIRDTSAGKV